MDIKKISIASIFVIIFVFVSWYNSISNKKPEVDPMDAFKELSFINSPNGSGTFEYFFSAERNKVDAYQLVYNAILKSHCSNWVDEHCNSFKFVKRKDEYTMSIHTQGEYVDVDQLMNKVGRLFTFGTYKVRQLKPKLLDVSVNKEADLVIKLIDEKQKSKACYLKMDIVNGVIERAFFEYSKDDYFSENYSRCESRQLIQFYNVQGMISVSDENLETKYLHIESHLILEFYRWLHLFKSYPENESELKTEVENFLKVVQLEIAP